MQTNVSFQEHEIMSDVLRSEKQMITSYGTFLAESTCQNLRNELTKIIGEQQQMQYQIYDVMQKKGWYQSKNANLDDVQTAAQKFQTMKQSMQ